MKVALLTDGVYPFVMGGMQKHSFNLARHFSRQKVEVEVFHYKANKEVKEEDVFSAEELEYLTFHEFTFPKLAPLPGHYLKESYQFSGSIYNKIKDRLKEFDFIYAQGFAAWRTIEAKKKGQPCPPIAVHFHGLEMYQKSADFRRRMEQFMFKKPVAYNLINADFPVSYGGKLTPLISGITKKPESVMVSPGAIDEDWLVDQPRKTGEKLNLLFLGRYERRKGVQELSAVLPSLAEEYDFNFHFVGPIPDDKKVISDKVIYHGQLNSEDEVKEKLRNCDLLVCPSFSEGMPNVILESMATGLAVIVTDVGAVAEMFDGNGWMITPGDKDLLKKTLVQAITASPEEIDAMKSKSQEIIRKKFLWESVIADTIDFINDKIK